MIAAQELPDEVNHHNDRREAACTEKEHKSKLSARTVVLRV